MGIGIGAGNGAGVESTTTGAGVGAGSGAGAGGGVIGVSTGAGVGAGVSATSFETGMRRSDVARFVVRRVRATSPPDVPVRLPVPRAARHVTVAPFAESRVLSAIGESVLIEYAVSVAVIFAGVTRHTERDGLVMRIVVSVVVVVVCAPALPAAIAPSATAMLT